MDNNHVHSFTDTVVPSTCKENGYTLHKCACGYEHKDNFQPLNQHSFAITAETQPTCTEKGLRKLNCTVCGEEKTEEIAPLGHVWGDWNIQIYPTCETDGSKVRFCVRCGQREDAVAPAIGHKLTAPQKSETQKGVKECLCANCGAMVTVPTAGGKFKAFLSRHKGAIIATCASLVVVAGGVFAAYKLLLPNIQKNKVSGLIEDGKYTEAYEYLMEHENCKDRDELLEKFTLKYTKGKQYVYVDGEARVGSEAEFDEHGNPTHLISYHENGKKSREEKYELIYEGVEAPKDVSGDEDYDPDYIPYDSITIYEAEYDEEGKLTYEFTTQYDDDGNKTQSIGKNDDGTLTKKVVY